MKTSFLKTMMAALLLVMAMPFVNAQVAHVGDILCEGDVIVSPANFDASSHTAIGVVFYVDNTGQHGWAVALQDAGYCMWGKEYSDTPLPNYTDIRQAIYDLDGYENTRIIREHGSEHTAAYAVDFENGWYIPTIGQFNYLYGNLVEVNEGIAVAGGTVFSRMTSWEYWSSTEYSGKQMWTLNSNGQLAVVMYWDLPPLSNYCYYSRDVRAVRNF